MTAYRALLWPFVILVSIFAVWIELISGSQSPLRPFITFWFLLVCPGMAYLPLLRLRDAVTTFVLGIALSVAIGTVVSEVLVLAHAWNPETALMIVIAFTLLGVAIQVWRFLQAGSQPGKLA